MAVTLDASNGIISMSMHTKIRSALLLALFNWIRLTHSQIDWKWFTIHSINGDGQPIPVDHQPGQPNTRIFQHVEFFEVECLLIGKIAVDSIKSGSKMIDKSFFIMAKSQLL